MQPIITIIIQHFLHNLSVLPSHLFTLFHHHFHLAFDFTLYFLFTVTYSTFYFFFRWNCFLWHNLFFFAFQPQELRLTIRTRRTLNTWSLTRRTLSPIRTPRCWSLPRTAASSSPAAAFISEAVSRLLPPCGQIWILFINIFINNTLVSYLNNCLFKWSARNFSFFSLEIDPITQLKQNTSIRKNILKMWI